eukprot:TRINITY_DN67416_c8_g1_i1.p1 TRINITY_DN67416_c8_g1~~TRINITY_DN67416_c8_g1_i1.p1  ORF type:complete len:242 (+),score=29.89 TRINITY_DN67416_c8_g1_i1:73-798(+)
MTTNNAALETFVRQHLKIHKVQSGHEAVAVDELAKMELPIYKLEPELREILAEQFKAPFKKKSKIKKQKINEDSSAKDPIAAFTPITTLTANLLPLREVVDWLSRQGDILNEIQPDKQDYGFGSWKEVVDKDESDFLFGDEEDAAVVAPPNTTTVQWESLHEAVAPPQEMDEPAPELLLPGVETFDGWEDTGAAFVKPPDHLQQWRVDCAMLQAYSRHARRFVEETKAKAHRSESNAKLAG